MSKYVKQGMFKNISYFVLKNILEAFILFMCDNC